MTAIYNEAFYDEQKYGSLQSAEIIVPIILRIFSVTSVIDVGCGVGTWLSIFNKNGVKKIKGFDTNDLPLENYFIEKDKIQTNCDLSSPAFSLNTKADMTICLEVAEHLHQTAADYLIKNLVDSSPVVVFSAAYPDQTGVNHVNEQPPWYWREKFNRHGYLEIDFIRPVIWTDERISWWYRQNITSFVHPSYIETNEQVLNIAVQYCQRPGPHRLTLVNEWILKNQFEHKEDLIQRYSEKISELSNKLKNRTDSIESHKKLIDSIKTMTSSSGALVEVGEIFYSADLKSDAKFFFEKALSLDHRNTNASNNLGVLAFQDKELETAKNCFLKALEADPNNNEARANLADVENLLSKSQKRILENETYVRSNCLDQDSPHGCIHIGTDQSVGPISSSSCNDNDHAIFTHLTKEEKLRLYELAKNTSGKVFVELGSYVGASSCFIAKGIRASNKSGKLYCVDTWQNEGMAEGFRDTYEEFINKTSHYKDIILPLRGNSVEVAKEFKKKVDFLFVDCDHSYEGVKSDVEAWFPKLNPGAIVIFHDIGWAEGVQKVVAEKVSPVVKNENRLPNMYWAWLKNPFLSKNAVTTKHGSSPLSTSEQIKAYQNSSERERQGYYEKSRNPSLLRERFIRASVPVRDATIDIADFEAWLRNLNDLVNFYGGHNDVMIEKCLEHYLAFKWLDLTPKDIYIDIAASSSIWAHILHNKMGIQSYRLDMIYPPGINGRDIGTDASNTKLPSGFASAMSLQCAFETFRNDADIRFISEAERLLSENGRLVILPLYTDEAHFILSSPYADLSQIQMDHGAIRVWREDEYKEPFSRHYSPEAFARRIYSQLKRMSGTVIYFSNLEELRSKFPGQRIYCDFMFYCKKETRNANVNLQATERIDVYQRKAISSSSSSEESNLSVQAEAPYLSVMIPTLNRAALLERALKSLTAQTFPGNLFEVIVIDNGSTDNTFQVCTKFEQKITNLRYVYDNNPGLHVGRHLGCKEARGEILVFGDDDIRAFPTWLEGIAESFRDPAVVLAGGKILPAFEIPPPAWVNALWWQTPWGRALGWYSLLDFGDKVLEISPDYVWGCNFSIRKTTLLEVGGFHPDSMPAELIRFRGDGETAVSIAVKNKGYKALYNPKASVYHFVSKDRMTFDYLYKRAFAQGVSDSYTQIRATGDSTGFKQLMPSHDELQNVINKGHTDGFNFHRKAVRADPELLKWVLRKDYFDYKLPEI